MLVFSAVTTESFRNDFRLYVAAAHLGLKHGFARIYEIDLQRQAVAGLTGTDLNYQPFISPPLAAWLATPLAPLSYQVGLLVWTSLLVICTLGTWWLIAPGHGGVRVAHLLLAVGFVPLGFAVSVGQLAPVIGLALAAAYLLIRADRPGLAGVALVVVWLKPQDALLVAPALLVSGRVRPFLSWATASAVLGLVTLASLGGPGLAAYRALLAQAGGWELMQRFSLPGQPFWGAWGTLVSLAVAVVTLVAARRQRADLGLVMAAGISGSLLLSPYLGLQDLALLVPAAWLAWRQGAPGWHFALAAVGYTVLELSLLLGPGPVLVAEVSWLLSLGLLRRDRGGAPVAPSRGRRSAPAPPRPPGAVPAPR